MLLNGADVYISSLGYHAHLFHIFSRNHNDNFVSSLHFGRAVLLSRGGRGIGYFEKQNPLTDRTKKILPRINSPKIKPKNLGSRLRKELEITQTKLILLFVENHFAFTIFFGVSFFEIMED